MSYILSFWCCRLPILIQIFTSLWLKWKKLFILDGSRCLTFSHEITKSYTQSVKLMSLFFYFPVNRIRQYYSWFKWVCKRFEMKKNQQPLKSSYVVDARCFFYCSHFLYWLNEVKVCIILMKLSLTKKYWTIATSELYFQYAMPNNNFRLAKFRSILFYFMQEFRLSSFNRRDG